MQGNKHEFFLLQVNFILLLSLLLYEQPIINNLNQVQVAKHQIRKYKKEALVVYSCIPLKLGNQLNHK